MEYFHNGDSGNLSLHDMIECDIKSEFCEQLPVRDLLAASPLAPPDYSPVTANSCLPADTALALGYTGGPASQMIGHKITSDSSWLQTVNLISVQNLVALQEPENSDPNLLVNPQTGLPVSLQQAGMSSASHPRLSQALGSTDAGTILQAQDHLNFLSPTVSTTAEYSGVASPMYSSPQLHAQHVAMHSRSAAIYQNPLVTRQLLQTSLNGHSHKTETLCSPRSLYPKPVYSYSCLIAMALKNSDTGALPVSEIYTFMTENFPYFKTAPDGWKNSVRHNLSLNKCFEKIDNPKSAGGTRKGCLWGLNPLKVDKMDDEICKWRKKDPAGIKRSMAKPEVLEQLEKGRVGSPSPRHASHPRGGGGGGGTPTPTRGGAAGGGAAGRVSSACVRLSMDVLPDGGDSRSAVAAHPHGLDLLDADLDPQLAELALQTGIWGELAGGVDTFDELGSVAPSGGFSMSSGGGLMSSAATVLTL